MKDDLCSLTLLNKLHEVERYFTQKKYTGIVKSSRELFECGQFDKCGEELDKLPDSGKLLEQLVKKLEGKSIGRTLKKIQEGKVEDSLLTAKCLSSLLTHIFIEVEHGNDEYKMLVPNIIEKLNENVYGMLRG